MKLFSFGSATLAADHSPIGCPLMNKSRLSNRCMSRAGRTIGPRISMLSTYSTRWVAF